MIKLNACIAAAVLTAFSANAAHAQVTQYGSEAGWDILVNQQMGPGCFIMHTTPEGVQIQMGINRAKDAPEGFIALYTQAPADVRAGQEIKVTFDVDGQKFTGDFKGQQYQDGWRGAYVRVNNPDFVYDLAKKYKLTITADDGRPPIVVDLTGTFAAFEALRACQKEQGS